jgi:hypothetical protein
LSIRTANVARALAAAVIFGLAIFGILVVYAPDSVALSPNNYGWNGIHEVSSAYAVNFTTSLSSVPPGSVLVIMQPSANFSAQDIAAVRAHLEKGGTVLVADKSGFANSLLQGLGSGVTVESQDSIQDPIYNWKASTLPTALIQRGVAQGFPFAKNVSGIALNLPSPLLLQGRNSTAIAATSQLSYVADATSKTQIVKGPFTVAAAERVGKGTLVVVSDSQFLLNSEWRIADNAAFIGNIFANSSVYIDASHWSSSPLTSSTAQLKAEFGQAYAVISAIPMRYLVTLSFVVVALLLMPGRERTRRRPHSPNER